MPIEKALLFFSTVGTTRTRRNHKEKPSTELHRSHRVSPKKFFSMNLGGFGVIPRKSFCSFCTELNLKKLIDPIENILNCDLCASWGLFKKTKTFLAHAMQRSPQFVILEESSLVLENWAILRGDSSAREGSSRMTVI